MSKDRLFIGPARTEWWKFAIAKRITGFRMRHSSLQHVPKFDAWVTDWALEQTIASRDIEVREGE